MTHPDWYDRQQYGFLYRWKHGIEARHQRMQSVPVGRCPCALCGLREMEALVDIRLTWEWPARPGTPGAHTVTIRYFDARVLAAAHARRVGATDMRMPRWMMDRHLRGHNEPPKEFGSEALRRRRQDA